MPPTISIDDLAVRWSHTASLAGRPLVLLLHGYGQDASSMQTVADALAPEVVTASLRGPRESLGRFEGGRGWYNVDERIQPLEDQENETSRAVLSWLDGVESQRGRPSSIGLVGFSQGAALALHLLRHAPERFAAVVTLAGFWLPGGPDAQERLAGSAVPVFWGRTEGDPAIAADLVDLTREALAANSTLEERVYPGDAHAIVPEELADAVAFLRANLV